MSAIFLDVSALEAPQPLQQALDALLQLKPGDYLHFHHRMRPCHLYTYLAEQGFTSDTRLGENGNCEVFIWHEDDAQAGRDACQAAAHFPPWKEH